MCALQIGGLSATDLVETYGSPLYVYDGDLIRRRYEELSAALSFPRTRIHYAMKANNNPAILQLLRSLGAGIDATSPGEVYLALRAGFPPADILFTGVNPSMDDLAYCREQGVQVNIGSLHVLEAWGARYPGSTVSVRVNPDVGAGHHEHTITGGPSSKFGIYHTEMQTVESIAESHGLSIVGLHSHIGSGILETGAFIRAMDIILDAARHVPGLSFVDIGGGIGVPYRPGEAPIPLAELGAAISSRFADFCTAYGADLSLKVEPGRFLVAEAGTLLATVTNLKKTSRYRFMGVDSGFNHLARPVLYGSYHHIENASRPDAPPLPYLVGGNLCESGDIFTRTEEGLEERLIASPEVGDVLAIRTCGAYGYSMASTYNSRLLPAEVMLSGGTARLTRRRQTLEDLTWADL